MSTATKKKSKAVRSEPAPRISKFKKHSMAAAVRKYSGIVSSGIGDLSTREGLGD
ncbi:hypothetical protein OpiT1DRAFT_04771 [Opitutaceae bacterium TAV1]|nr:hypothetical protein OpiT1DRAFT_04771 [Opitutaceae bacterium TAV1]